MFAKHKMGAACLADYRDIKKGGIVPRVNELYAQVEEWLESNEWAELPDDFGQPIKTFDQEIQELNQNYDTNMQALTSEYALAMARDGLTETNKVQQVREKITALDAQYETDQMEIIQRYS